MLPLPLVHRELLVATRRPAVYWARVAAAVTTVFFCQGKWVSAKGASGQPSCARMHVPWLLAGAGTRVREGWKGRGSVQQSSGGTLALIRPIEAPHFGPAALSCSIVVMPGGREPRRSCTLAGSKGRER